jgi:hypothetical protein
MLNVLLNHLSGWPILLEYQSCSICLDETISLFRLHHCLFHLMDRLVAFRHIGAGIGELGCARRLGRHCLPCLFQQAVGLRSRRAVCRPIDEPSYGCVGVLHPVQIWHRELLASPESNRINKNRHIGISFGLEGILTEGVSVKCYNPFCGLTKRAPDNRKHKFIRVEVCLTRSYF